MIVNAKYKVIDPKKDGNILGYDTIELIERRLSNYSVVEVNDDQFPNTKYKVFHDYEWVVKVSIDNETGEYDFITFDESELFEAILYYQLVQE